MKEILANESINKWSDEDLMEAAKKDLGEDPVRVAQDLEIIKTWISKSPHLHSIKQEINCDVRFFASYWIEAE